MEIKVSDSLYEVLAIKASVLHMSVNEYVEMLLKYFAENNE